MLAGLLVGTAPARACDLCAIYTATTMQEIRRGPWLSISEQFTSFNTLELNDSEIGNFDNEWIQSSITQFVAGYTFTDRLSLQLNVPVISREFRRATLTGVERDSEEGIGDIALVGRYSLVRTAYARGVFNWDLMMGLKMPTGDTDRLGEETADPDAALVLDADASRPAHDGPGGAISGVHGHDLTLGTGSWDLIVGTNLVATWRRAVLLMGMQYMVRTEGDFDYEYANDLQFQFAPGAYLLLGHEYTVALHARLSGESKGKDNQGEVKLDDTQITALELGPMVTFSYLDRLSGELGFSLPLFHNTTDLQIVSDYRIRAGLTWRF